MAERLSVHHNGLFSTVAKASGAARQEPVNAPVSMHRTQEDEESDRKRGRLKIFFSYAPGTGKTLAMLEDAYRRQQEGLDVVVGYVDARGEMLAMQLLEKFEVLPQRVVAASGMSYQGMDLDLLLARRPHIALVDHLARANPPGLRHIARYLEVEELLNAGIDVYTTLNIYQMESQVDSVSYLTGVTVRETLPDRFMDEAEQLEMVDMPPQELLERYHSRKISFPPRAEMQLKKFFQPGNLFALRELALRYVAHRSNTLMRTFLKDRGWAQVDTGTPQLLVCISDSAESAHLVRAGRRMADETGAEWTVIYVETPDQIEISGDRQAKVAQNLRLAELLGAKTESLTGRTVIDAVRTYIRKHHIRRIMIGRSSHRRWYQLFDPSLAEQLLREDPAMTIYLVGSDLTPQPFQMSRVWKWISRMQLLGSLGLVLIPTLIGQALYPHAISRSANMIMFYLLAVVIASVSLGLVPALLTAVLSVLVYDYYFIPPIHSLFGFASENAITVFGLLVFSAIVSTLVSREKSLARAAHRRAEQVTQLYDLSKDLATAVGMEDILATVVLHFRRTFDRTIVILLPKDGSLVLSASSAGETLDSSELPAAEWAFQQGRPAGHNTGTFSYASFRYFPLETTRGIIGVMGVRLSGEKDDLHPEQMRMVSTYVTKAASTIERALFAEEASQTQVLRATEKLQTALLNSISHDLRTPLASITGVLSSLRMNDDFIDQETRRELVETALGEAERLNRLVGNLLDMTRLESGAIKISLQPCDIQDVIGSALNAVNARLEGHPVDVNLPVDLPLISLDYVLINQVLINLLDNAAKYSPEDGPIVINGRLDHLYIRIEVEDRGPGIPEEDLERIFEKFYRVKRFENVVGTGLGLSICKGIVEVHGGKIWAENRSGGGVKMVVLLPLKPTAINENEAESAVQELHEEMQS